MTSGSNQNRLLIFNQLVSDLYLYDRIFFAMFCWFDTVNIPSPGWTRKSGPSLRLRSGPPEEADERDDEPGSADAERGTVLAKEGETDTTDPKHDACQGEDEGRSLHSMKPVL